MIVYYHDNISTSDILSSLTIDFIYYVIPVACASCAVVGCFTDTPTNTDTVIYVFIALPL